MEIPITRFRRNLFSFIETALEGKEVWVRHKGQRVRLVPENQPTDKLSRITPLEIVAPGVNLEDSSWKGSITDAWEQKWDGRLDPVAKPSRKASPPSRTNARKNRRTA
jgi:hypothetical protein